MTTWKYSRAIALLLVASVAGAVYLTGGSALQENVTSPDKRQRVEFYSLSRWQQLVRLSTAVDDQVVSLRDLRTDRVLGRSGVFYASGIGHVRWTATEVAIGAAGRFDRRTGRWSQDEAAD